MNAYSLEQFTYVVQRRTMLRQLNHLYRRIGADPGRIVGGQRHLRETEVAVVLLIAGTGDLEDCLHGQGVAGRDGVIAKIDVKEGGGMAGEPAWLNADGAAGNGPEGSICRHWHASACDGGCQWVYFV